MSWRSLLIEALDALHPDQLLTQRTSDRTSQLTRQLASGLSTQLTSYAVNRLTYRHTL